MTQTVTFNPSSINIGTTQPGATNAGASQCAPLAVPANVTASITNDTSGGALTILSVASYLPQVIPPESPGAGGGGTSYYFKTKIEPQAPRPEVLPGQMISLPLRWGARLVGQSNGITPLAVAAGEFVQVTVQFAPTASTPAVCTATLQINGDTWNSVSLPVTATVGELTVSVPPITVTQDASTSVEIAVTSVAGNDTTASLILTSDASPEAANVTTSLSLTSLSIGKGQTASTTLSVSASSNLPTGPYIWSLGVWAFDAQSFSVPVTINVVTDYVFIRSKLGNVIDVAGASTAPGTLLDAYPQKSVGTDNQLWKFVADPAGSGYYFIESKLGNVVDVAGASTAPGTPLDAYPQKSTGTDNQLWQFVADPAGYCFIVSKLNGNVIDIAGASTASGTPLDAYPRTGTDNQLWQIVPDPAGSGYVFIKSKLNGNVIDVAGASTASGTPLDAYPQKSTGTDNQLWQIVPDSAGSGYFFIESKLNSNVIDAARASTAPGTPLDASPQKSTGTDNQLWQFVADPAGYCFIMSKLNGNVIDVAGASTAPGTKLDAYPWKYAGYDNQLWNVVNGTFPSTVWTVPQGRPLGGTYQYIFANGLNCATLTGVKVTIYFTEDLVWEKVTGGGNAAFSIQLNAETEKSQPLDWLQFIWFMNDDQKLVPDVQIWGPPAAQTDIWGRISPPWNSIATMPQAARIPAGYSLKIELQSDSQSKVVTGATWNVRDSSGNQVGSPASHTLSGVKSSDLSPVASFQLTFGSNGGGGGATFSSGAGVIIYEADQAMTVDSSWPSCIGYQDGTAEGSNIGYGPMSAAPSKLLVQAFGILPQSAQMMRKAKPSARKLGAPPAS